MNLMKSILIGLVACSCVESGPPGMDIEPPVVVAFSPEGQDVDPASLVTVTFSEAIDSSAVDEPLIFLVPYEDADADFLDDADRPPLALKRRQLVIPCSMDSSPSGNRVLLTPEHPLNGDSDYLVVVSAAVKDLAGNPLVADPFLDDKGVMVGIQTHVLHHFKTISGHDAPTDDPVDDPDDDPDDDPADGPTEEKIVVISEIMSNPIGTESHGEYIEVVNLGSSPVDLAGWLIGDRGLAGDGDAIGTCQNSTDAVLAPKAIGLIAGMSFVEPANLDQHTVVMCTDRNNLTPRGLKNTKGEVLVLSDASGMEVDRYGGWLSMNRDGCSAYRVDLATENSEENWLLADGEPCSTPGWIPGFPP